MDKPNTNPVNDHVAARRRELLEWYPLHELHHLCDIMPPGSAFKLAMKYAMGRGFLPLPEHAPAAAHAKVSGRALIEPDRGYIYYSTTVAQRIAAKGILTVAYNHRRDPGVDAFLRYMETHDAGDLEPVAHWPYPRLCRDCIERAQ
jgi:hypothetical protein